MSDDIRRGSQSIADLGLVADLPAEPWTYPGPFLPFSCLQVADRLLPLRAEPGGQLFVTIDGRREDLRPQLRERAEPELDARHFVIAIGSNASPDVIRRKFERSAASTTIIHLLARLERVALGYSAHVSPAGYIPVAAYPRTPATTDVVVSALTDEQLHCLDETEPNYDRMTVAASRVQLSLPVRLPEYVHIYLSRWGVIVDETKTPLPFGRQSTIFDQLATWRVLPPSIAVTADVHRITRTLGQHEELRAKVRDNLTRHSERYPESDML